MSRLWCDDDTWWERFITPLLLIPAAVIDTAVRVGRRWGWWR